MCLKWRLVSNKRRDVRVVRSYVVGIGTRKIIINVIMVFSSLLRRSIFSRRMNGLIFRDEMLSRIYVSDFRFQLAVLAKYFLMKRFIKKHYYILIPNESARVRAFILFRARMYVHTLAARTALSRFIGSNYYRREF